MSKVNKYANKFDKKIPETRLNRYFEEDLQDCKDVILSKIQSCHSGEILHILLVIFFPLS